MFCKWRKYQLPYLLFQQSFPCVRFCSGEYGGDYPGSKQKSDEVLLLEQVWLSHSLSNIVVFLLPKIISCFFRRQVQTPSRPTRSISSSITRVVRRGTPFHYWYPTHFPYTFSIFSHTENTLAYMFKVPRVQESMQMGIPSISLQSYST